MAAPSPPTLPTEPMPPVLTVSQTARLLRMSLRATYRAVENNAIEHIRIGRRIAIPTAKLFEQLGLPLDGIERTVD